MPFQIIRNDITKVKADAIVNTANPMPLYANGTDRAIYEAAGADQLLAERKKIGPIKRGEVAVTPAFQLNAKYIIHAVGPGWEGGNHGEYEILQSAYEKSLEKARKLGCQSIAFPLMATGVNGFPKRHAMKIAMQKWGHKYPNAGYGCRFYDWLHTRHPKPYNSCGNGSGMRVSAAGWLYDTMERTREVARATAVVTHNHPEGIKGAEATASAMFLARTGADKAEIKAYIEQEFGYDLSRTCDEIRPGYYHVETCQKTIPEAITAFLESTDYEDAIRNAVSLGGDTDTLAAITGAIAEAYYGIPVGLIARGKSFLPDEMLEVIHRFDVVLGRAWEGRKQVMDFVFTYEFNYEDEAITDIWQEVQAYVDETIEAEGLSAEAVERLSYPLNLANPQELERFYSKIGKTH